MIIVGCASNVTNSCIFFYIFEISYKEFVFLPNGSLLSLVCILRVSVRVIGRGSSLSSQAWPSLWVSGVVLCTDGVVGFGRGGSAGGKKTSIIDGNEDELPHTRMPHHYTNRIFTHESQLRGRLNFSNMVIGDDRSELFSSLAVM